MAFPKRRFFIILSMMFLLSFSISTALVLDTPTATSSSSAQPPILSKLPRLLPPLPSLLVPKLPTVPILPNPRIPKILTLPKLPSLPKRTSLYHIGKTISSSVQSNKLDYIYIYIIVQFNLM